MIWGFSVNMYEYLFRVFFFLVKSFWTFSVKNYENISELFFFLLKKKRAHLSCKFKHLWKKNILEFFCWKKKIEQKQNFKKEKKNIRISGGGLRLFFVLLHHRLTPKLKVRGRQVRRTWWPMMLCVSWQNSFSEFRLQEIQTWPRNMAGRAILLIQVLLPGSNGSNCSTSTFKYTLLLTEPSDNTTGRYFPSTMPVHAIHLYPVVLRHSASTYGFIGFGAQYRSNFVANALLTAV